jgi:hypothetical protein
MPSASEVLEILDGLGIAVTGSIVNDAAGSGRLYVFVGVVRDSENHQVPSNRKLIEAKAILAERGVDIEFILTDEQQKDAEAGLRATLLHSFGGVLRNVFLSTEGRRANVWLDLKTAVESQSLTEINAKAAVFLNEVGLELQALSATASQNLPSKTACLRTIRQLAPVLPSRLITDLRAREFVIPSDDWMARRLDLLRKAGVVIRLQDGRYALSMAGLTALGSAKDASSPDITRLLALAHGHQ